MANLVQVRRQLGDRVGRDVLLLSITLDPERDTPDVLGEYARRLGAGDGWYFLTGRPQDVEALRRALGVTDPDPVIDRDRSQHSGLLVYGNDSVDRWSAIPALLRPELIVRAVQRLTAR